MYFLFEFRHLLGSNDSHFLIKKLLEVSKNNSNLREIVTIKRTIFQGDSRLHFCWEWTIVQGWSERMYRRSPWQQQGTRLSTKKISDLLPEVISDIGRRGRLDREAVYALWASLLGEKMAPLTEPISLADGVLTIKVKSATLYSLLSVHEKARLLKLLKEKFPIRDLQFKVG